MRGKAAHRRADGAFEPAAKKAVHKNARRIGADSKIKRADGACEPTAKKDGYKFLTKNLFFS